MCLLLLSLILNLSKTSAATLFFEDKLTGFNFVSRYATHPMLYFNADDVHALRQQALTTHSHIAKELSDAVEYIQTHPNLMPPETYEAFGSKWNEVYGNNLPVLAFHYTLFPKEGDLDFIIKYMDRMTAYESWYVAAMRTDEVPIAHCLVGYLTAYDMIYPHIDKDRQKKYADKIIETSRQMFEASAKRSWGDHYLQNHQASNIVALFMGSLISELHSNNPEIGQWKKFAVTMYERTMVILREIKDGSLDEGVGYVGYTVRSLSQYVYLVKRHLGYDHSSHPWLKKHLEYMYLTIIPGLQRTVGIADSPQGWFYGPESQLVFLDSYALRNGNGNWLALEIKKHKMPLMKERRPDPQRFTTLHTEFLFYDASLRPQPLEGYDQSQLHWFRDWGVVTYRSGSIMDNQSTFLSFKSSKIHGEYVNKIANSVRDKTLKGWTSFNPGHEHADQNSFTLWMSGEPFVSEGLYGPKYPYLDNVLMFLEKDLKAKDQYTPCTYPWVGQLGNCKQWLTWKGKEEGRSHGEIIAAVEEDGMVFTSGDAAGSYTSALGIQHAYRSSLLLREDLLVVFDHVMLTRTSKVSRVAAFFNNFMHTFRATKHRPSKLSGFTLDVNSKYNALWSNVFGKSPGANVSVNHHKSSGKEIAVSNANVTYLIRNRTSSVAFVFAGPTTAIKEFGVSKSQGHADVHLKTNGDSFRIRFSLDIHNPQDKSFCTVHEEMSKLVVDFRKNPISSEGLKDAIVRSDATFDTHQVNLDEHDEVQSTTEDQKYMLLFGAFGVVVFFSAISFSNGSKACISNPTSKRLLLVGFVSAVLVFIAIF